MRPITKERILTWETTQPKGIYEVHVEVDKTFNADYLASVLYERFQAAFPDLKINWIDACPVKQTITFQFIDTSNPIAIATILTLLPAILALAGVVAVLLSVWNVISAVPAWAWALLAVGMILLIFGPGIAKALTPTQYAQAPPPLAYRYAY